MRAGGCTSGAQGTTRRLETERGLHRALAEIPESGPRGKSYVLRPRGSEGWRARGVRVTAGVGVGPLRVTLDKVLWA